MKSVEYVYTSFLKDIVHEREETRVNDETKFVAVMNLSQHPDQSYHKPAKKHVTINCWITLLIDSLSKNIPWVCYETSFDCTHVCYFKSDKPYLENNIE